MSLETTSLETIAPIPRYMIVPQQTEMVFTVICFVGMLLTIAYMVIKIRQRGDLIPLYISIGALLAFFYEPFAHHMIWTYFPEQGQMTAIDVVGRKVPLFMVFAYVFYIAPFVIFFLDWVEKGITRKAWWISYAIAVVLAALFEELGIFLGLWTYYGDQPYRLFGFPLWLGFGFISAFVYGYAAVAYGMMKNLPKRVHWIIAPAGPFVISGVHLGAILPATIALNTTMNMVWLYVWTTTSILLSLMFIWVLSLLFVKD